MSRERLPKIPDGDPEIPEADADQPEEWETGSPAANRPLDKLGRRLRGGGAASAIGLTLVIAIVIGYVAGSWLDRRLGTDSICMAVGVLLGFAAGVVEMFRVVSATSKR